jgi:hypothetical protein
MVTLSLNIRVTTYQNVCITINSNVYITFDLYVVIPSDKFIFVINNFTDFSTIRKCFNKCTGRMITMVSFTSSSIIKFLNYSIFSCTNMVMRILSTVLGLWFIPVTFIECFLNTSLYTILFNLDNGIFNLFITG